MSAENFMCGVVEGFYGQPWNARQRHQLFGWMKSWGLNTYLYAPKDDLKHRVFWRELYDEAQAAEMAALIRDCQHHELNFIYALAPGLSFDYAIESREAALQRKAGQLVELGCQHFALLFDDIAPVTATGAVSFGATVATEQATFANQFLNFLREESPNGRLLFCPTAYCGRMAGSVKDSAYLRELGRTLDPAIHVLWTGPEIVSETISVESVRELQSVIRRKPIIWDNLHANDYDLRRLYLGPYSGRPVELRTEVAGILSNPNCEFEVNFVPLRTLASYVDAGNEWNPRAAYLAALKEWLPSWKLRVGDPITIHRLEMLGDCFYLPYEFGKRAQDLFDSFRSLLRTPVSAWGSNLGQFEHTHLVILVLINKVTALDNRDLLYAFYRHLWELKEEIDLLQRYVRWLQSKPKLGDVFVSQEHRPKTYRGGFVAELQRLLPMNDAGGFNHRSSLIPPAEPHGYR